MNTQKPHVSPRKGSGRKPAGTVRISLNVKPETLAMLKQDAEANYSTMGQSVDALARELLPPAQIAGDSFRAVFGNQSNKRPSK